MIVTPQNKAKCQALYDAALEFSKLEPWTWMYDSDIFGVQDPATGEIGWCCIMGAAEEVFGMMIYTGDAGYRSYLRIVDSAEMDYSSQDRMAIGLEQLGLQVGFELPEDLYENDQEVVEALQGGSNAMGMYPVFKDFSPGLLPWSVSDAQLDFIGHCLEQATYVANALKKNPEMLYDENENIWVRQPQKTANGLQWTDVYVDMPVEYDEVDIEVNPFLIARAKKLERKDVPLGFSQQYMNAPVMDEEEGDERPYFPKLTVWIDGTSGEPVHNAMLDHQAQQAFYENIVADLEQIGFLPHTIVVGSDLCEDALFPFCEALGIELAFDETFAQMTEMMSMMTGMMEQFSDEELADMQNMDQEELIRRLSDQMDREEDDMGRWN